MIVFCKFKSSAILQFGIMIYDIPQILITGHSARSAIPHIPQFSMYHICMKVLLEGDSMNCANCTATLYKTYFPNLSSIIKFQAFSYSGSPTWNAIPTSRWTLVVGMRKVKGLPNVFSLNNQYFHYFYFHSSIIPFNLFLFSFSY